jgi:hypothetical protein
MKTVNLSIASAIAALALTAHAARADCGLGTIQGDYTFVVHGQSLSADGSTSTGLLDGVGVITFDGAGDLAQEDYVVKSGTQVPGGNPNPSGFHTQETGTYSVNPDCTGAANIVLSPGNERNLAFVISTREHSIHAVATSTLVNGSPAVLQVYSDFQKIY